MFGRVTTAIASLLILVLTPFLLLSESSIKDLIDSWLNGCLVVFEKSDIPPNKVKVNGYVSGTPPKSLPITFAATDGLINRIMFSTDVDKANVSNSVNLALHPLTNSACPGTLCEKWGNVPSSPKLTIVVDDFSPAFLYSFVVEFDKPGDKDQLRIFVQYNEGLKDGICRVEYANAFNFFTRATKWTKFLALTLIFIVLTVFLGSLRRSGGEDKS